MDKDILKIYDVVNNTRKKVTSSFKAAFESEYNPRSYSNITNYGKSVLEFILTRYGVAIQDSWEYDTIFKFAPHIVIDWKVINEKYETAAITSITAKGYHTFNRPVTHYGFIHIHGNPFLIGDTLSFELVELKDKKYVWDNPVRVLPSKNGGEYFTYRPKKNLQFSSDIL